MKELWLDVETTGLSHYKNFVHQLAILIVIDGEIVEKLDLKVQPPRGTLLNKVALKIGDVTPEILSTYPPHNEVYKNVVEVFSKYVDQFNNKDKFTMHGYNVNFDVGFMRAFFVANNDQYYGSWVWSNNIDVMSIAGKYLKSERHLMKNFKLGTVAEYMGIKPQGVGLHDGMTDILLTRDIYLKINEK